MRPFEPAEIIHAVGLRFGELSQRQAAEFDLIEAKAAALVSDATARLAVIELRCMERIAETEARCRALEVEASDRIAERLSEVRDGRDADVAPLVAAVEAAIAAIPEVRDGRDIDPEEVRRMVAEAVAEIPAPKDGETPDIAPLVAKVDAAIAAIPEVRDGQDVDPDEVRRMVEAAVAALPQPEPGKDADEEAIARSVLSSLPSKEELRGEPGRLPIVKAWADGVHYAGDVVAHRGATWQALRDTGREPGGDDWVCIAARGVDGRSLEVRGTWEEGRSYEEKDVAILGGSAFVAKRDEPGPCPGDGWQLLASRGKTGEGKPGLSVKGDPGPPGPAPLALTLEDETVLTITLADGSQLACDLYELLARR